MNLQAAQEALIRLGYNLGPAGADGKDGPITRAAVTAFQKDAGLKPDGKAGPKTAKALEKALAAQQEAPVATPTAGLMLDRGRFFAYLRSGKAPMFGKQLSQRQVDGINGILDGFAVTGDGRPKTLAYGLATARREVGSGMQPVREGFKKTDEAAREYVAANYPNKGYSKPAGPWAQVYYGRGYVQLTHYENYEKEGIAADPDRALDPEFAAQLMFAGLLDGRWNGKGKGIAYYLPSGGPDDLKNARRTVNITDHWQEIADFYQQFMAAIAAAR